MSAFYVAHSHGITKARVNLRFYRHLRDMTSSRCVLDPVSCKFLSAKYRNKLDAAPDMRVVLSTLTPDWDAIMTSKRPHMSH